MLVYAVVLHFDYFFIQRKNYIFTLNNACMLVHLDT